MSMSTLRWFLVAAILLAGFSLSSSAADKKPDEPKKEEPKNPDEPKKKDPKDMNADEANDAGLCPVCKGEFKPVYHVEFKDKEYKFRTRECSKKFAANPAQYGAIGKDWKPPVDSNKP